METGVIEGIEYKIGLRGKVFKKYGDDWLYSEKPVDEVKLAIQFEKENIVRMRLKESKRKKSNQANQEKRDRKRKARDNRSIKVKKLTR